MTVPNSYAILALQELGAASYRAGASGMDNPYRMNTDPELCTAWIRGFNMARTDRAREIELGR